MIKEDDAVKLERLMHPHQDEWKREMMQDVGSGKQVPLPHLRCMPGLSGWARVISISIAVIYFVHTSVFKLPLLFLDDYYWQGFPIFWWQGEAAASAHASHIFHLGASLAWLGHARARLGRALKTQERRLGQRPNRDELCHLDRLSHASFRRHSLASEALLGQGAQLLVLVLAHDRGRALSLDARPSLLTHPVTAHEEALCQRIAPWLGLAALLGHGAYEATCLAAHVYAHGLFL